MAKVAIVNLSLTIASPDDIDSVEQVRTYLSAILGKHRMDGSVYRIERIVDAIALLHDIENALPEDWWMDVFPTQVKIWDATYRQAGDSRVIHFGRMVLDTTPGGIDTSGDGESMN